MARVIQKRYLSSHLSSASKENKKRDAFVQPPLNVNERVEGWKDKDLQRGWAFQWIWVDAAFAKHGYLNPHDGYWLYEDHWTPSVRQQAIKYAHDLRERYDSKLDACRKWWLNKCWRDWRCAVSLNKLQVQASAVCECLSQWYKALPRVQALKETQMRIMLWHFLAKKQMKTMSIVFHRWLQLVHHQTGSDILIASTLFCLSAHTDL